MCTYSAKDGFLTDFHFQHLSAFSFRGASLTIIEATSVLPNGGITPQDSGLWSDAQIAPIRRIADFVHSQGQKLGIQLAHAGRKASTLAPWLVGRGESDLATEDVGGWPADVMGPSAIPWGKGYATPREMTAQDIKDLINGFRDAAKRAVEAGVDVIEIHAAHGYLFCSWMSPIGNKRTDQYGGSFENRIRLLLETIKAVREVIPSGMPLLVRVSSTEWMENSGEPESWDVESTIRLAKLLPALGVDLLDVSSGGNHEKQVIPRHNVDYQVDIAARIRAELLEAGIKGLLIGAVGLITEAEAAKSIVENGKEGPRDQVEIENERGVKTKADIVLVARQFLREPEWVFRVAYKLGVEVKWPIQYHRGQFRKDGELVTVP